MSSSASLMISQAQANSDFETKIQKEWKEKEWAEKRSQSNQERSKKKAT